MPFDAIFEKVDKFAEKFGQEISNKQLQDIIRTCMPYFMDLRKRFGFFRIPTENIREEVAPSAINQAFLIQQRRKKTLSFCLQNAFRDCCRQQLRRLREHDTNNILSQCDIADPPKVIGSGTGYPSPPANAQDKELLKLTENILKDHEDLSKKVVYEKTRGSTYPEMVKIFDTDLNECKRVYWHDIDDLRKKLNPNSEVEL